MAQPAKATILDHFTDLDDLRVERTRRHKLVDIIAIICGAERTGGTARMLDHHRRGRSGLPGPRTRWPQLKAAVRVVGHRQTQGGAISPPRYCISSLAAPAAQLLAAFSSHWSIENSLHWTLGVTFREDQCRVSKDHGPQNMATLRQIRHNLLKNERTLKVGIQGKRLNAGWDESCLLRVLPG